MIFDAEFLTAPEAAVILGVTRERVAMMAKTGILASKKFGKSYAILASAVQDRKAEMNLHGGAMPRGRTPKPKEPPPEPVAKPARVTARQQRWMAHQQEAISQMMESAPACLRMEQRGKPGKNYEKNMQLKGVKEMLAALLSAHEDGISYEDLKAAIDYADEIVEWLVLECKIVAKNVEKPEGGYAVRYVHERFA